MTIDFFVHLSSPFTSTGIWHYINLLEEYGEDLLKSLRLSELPILVNGLNLDEGFGDMFSKSNSVRSASYKDGVFTIGRGEISSEDWEKTIDLIRGHESEPMRIHGSFFGQCTTGLAAQLFAYIHNGEHLHNWRIPPNDRECRIEWKRQKSLLKKYEREGSFFRSKIRFGAVMHPIEKINIISASDKLPYGNVTSQFIDSGTKIHGKSAD